MTSRRAPKEIVKEGLSEYFIYTIEGTETIHNGWSKRMRSLEAAEVPVKIQYRYRPAGIWRRNWCGCTFSRTTRNRNSARRRCPTAWSALFRDNGRDGLSFLVAQAIKYIPIGDKIELNLGPDPEVIFELIKLKTCATTSGCNSTAPTSSAAWISRACRSRSTVRVAGWDDHMLYCPADPQLHGQADRIGNPPRV